MERKRAEREHSVGGRVSESRASLHKFPALPEKDKAVSIGNDLCARRKNAHLSIGKIHSGPITGIPRRDSLDTISQVFPGKTQADEMKTHSHFQRSFGGKRIRIT